MFNYNPVVSNEDPMISIQLPAKIVKDLAKRAVENGHSLTMEISIRLARSLERDLEMIAADNEMAYREMEMVHIKKH